MSDRAQRNALWLRGGLALVAGADILWLALLLWRAQPGELTNFAGPGVLVALAGARASIALCALVGWIALLVFARGRAPIISGLIAEGALGLLALSHSAIVGGPWHNFFHSGAALLGWVIGLCYVRLASWFARRAGQPLSDERGAERFALDVAVALIAATYVSAGLGKLADGGLGWTNPISIQSLALAHRNVDSGGGLDWISRFVVGNPWLGRLLSVATVIIQSGALVLLWGGRARMVWAALLVGFHMGVFVLTGIPYVESVVVLGLLCYPWRMDFPRLPAAANRRALWVAFALAYLALLLAWWSPLRRYNELYHQYSVNSGRPTENQTQDNIGQPTEDKKPPTVEPFIEAGREADVLRLIAPLALGEKVSPTRKLEDAHVGRASIRLVITDKQKVTTGELLLRFKSAKDTNGESTPSFAAERSLSAADVDTAHALDLVLARVRANDDGHFWHTPPQQLNPPPPVPAPLAMTQPAPTPAPTSRRSDRMVERLMRYLIPCGGLLALLALCAALLPVRKR